MRILVSCLILLLCWLGFCACDELHEIFQRYNGWDNNLNHRHFGSVDSPFHYLSPPVYQDGVRIPWSISRPPPGVLSAEMLSGPDGIVPDNEADAKSMLFVYFAQIVQEEIMNSISHGEIACPAQQMHIGMIKSNQCRNISLMEEDQLNNLTGLERSNSSKLCPNNVTTEWISIFRIPFDPSTSKHVNNPRRPLNQATSWIDGSFLYSSSEPILQALREWTGGRLRTNQTTGYPLKNTVRVPIPNPPSPKHHDGFGKLEKLYLLGNPKGGQEPGSLGLSFVFVRYHNWLADHTAEEHPDWNDEQLFQTARRLFIAHLQKIILYDFLPELLGTDGLPRYKEYKAELDPQISVEFQAAAFRFGHSLVPPGLYVADESCNFTGIPYCRIWWDAEDVMNEYGLEAVLRGMLGQKAEKMDPILSNGIREELYGPLSASKRDLGAVNILRGREEGLADYNSVRAAIGLDQIFEIRQINSNLHELKEILFHRMQDLYGESMTNIDLYVAGLLESTGGGLLGPTFKAIIKEQFIRIRDADRFWFENPLNGLFSEKEVKNIFENVTLASIFRKVTNLSTDHLPDNMFKYRSSNCSQPKQLVSSDLDGCPQLHRFDYMTGSGAPFVLTYAFLAFFPVFICLIGWLTAKRRDWASNRAERNGKQPERGGGVAAGKNINANNRKSFRKSLRKSARSGGHGYFSAYEYNGPNDKSRVTIRVNPGPLIQIWRNAAESSTRHTIDLRLMRYQINIYQNKMVSSSAGASGGSGVDCVLLIKVPKNYDAILLFDNRESRDGFYRFLESELLSAGKDFYLHDDKSAGQLLEKGVTRAHRQAILHDFFSTAFHQVHKANEKSKRRQTFDGRTNTSTAAAASRAATMSRNDGKNASVSQSRIVADMELFKAAERPNAVRELKKSLWDIELNTMEFAEALQLKPESIFVQQMFRLADKDQNGLISYPEFIDILGLFSKGNLETKMRMMFDMYDLDGSGDLDREEFATMIRSLLEVTKGGKLSDEEIEKLSRGMLNECGIDQRDEITFTDFYTVVTKHQSLIWNSETNEKFGFTSQERKLSTDGRNSSSNQMPMDGDLTLAESDQVPGNLGLRYWQTKVENNWNQIFLSLLYVMITSFIFVYYFIKYTWLNEHRGTRQVTGLGASVSRASAMCINFTMALLLLGVCRNLLARIRSSALGYYIPCDSSISAHRALAMWIMLFSAIHIIGHGFNFYHISTQPPEVLRCLFPDVSIPDDSLVKFQFWVFGTVTGVTGVLLVMCMSVVYVFASPYARRRIFSSFWSTHQLWPFIYLLCGLHGTASLLQPPSFYVWVIGPLTLYIFDWIIRLRRHALNMKIANVEPLHSGVLHLSLQKPVSLRYRSGQWVRVACHAVASDEFHPFTITTAPHEKTLDVYIRSCGPWTKRMYSYFSENADSGEKLPKITIEGPFGSSHEDWLKFKCVVLVGAGIGVTPHASVLKDLVHKVYHQKSEIATRHVYFVWLSRGHQQFEWLIEILRQVEEMDKDNLLTIDIFITQLIKDFDIRTMMLYICEHQFQRLSGRSLFTGIRARTHFGRIDMKNYLQYIQRKHPLVSKIGVFSCGPKTVVRNVDSVCQELNKTGVKPSFIAYHEIF